MPAADSRLEAAVVDRADGARRDGEPYDSSMASNAEAVPLADDTSASRTDWEKATAAVLRKSGRLAEDAPDTAVWQVLTRTTLDGIGVTPLGIPDETADLPSAGLPGQAPFTRGSVAARADSAWDIRARFADPDRKITADHVLTDLENGVTSIWLAIGEAGIAPADLAQILEPVFIDLAPTLLEPLDDAVTAARAFLAVADDKGVDPAPGTNLGADPIGASLRHQQMTDTDAIVAQIAPLALERSLRGFVVDGTAVHDLGASDVQELAYLLAAGVAYLRKLADCGIGVDEAAGILEFRIAANDEQFPTIAKFRAARTLWNRVTELSGVAERHRGQAQHAVTSRPMLSKYDPYVNMLRTTIASFAAGVGGANAVTVLPFDEPLGLPEAFSRRIARNTSSLLISESHVARVSDPAGGSHIVEKLTSDLARAAWQAFGAVEAAGGVEALIADGTLAAEIAEVAEKRAAKIAKRSQPITGVSEFPNLHEVLPERRPHPAGSVEALRYGAEYEALRDHRASTPVFLATLGPIARHTARATFVANLFAAGGIDTVTAGATENAAQVAGAYSAAGSPPVVCLAGHDTTYAEWGAEVVSALRAAGASHVIVAGASGLDVDDTAAVGIDALDFLRRTRQRLGANA